MPKRYVYNTVQLVAPYNVSDGDGLRVGAIIGIATHNATSGAAVTVQLVGVYDVEKMTDFAWTLGARVFWDDSARKFTVDAAGGSNYSVGVALAAAATGATIGKVRLDGHFGL